MVQCCNSTGPSHYYPSSKHLSASKPLKTMHHNTSCLLAFLILQFLKSHASAGFGVGVGVGGGGTGVWIGGGGGAGGGVGSSNPSGSPLKVAYFAIQAWKSAITDDPYNIMKTWVGPSVCSYKGIFCAESQNGNGLVVAGIDLNKASLQGILVDELSQLSDLSLIHLNSNRFSGTIPESFKDLNFLQELDLSNNLFSGSFPESTLQIPNLLYLDLRFNSFTGPIPEEVFCKSLDAVLLNNNHFQGPIPSSLGNSPASVINLANNMLTGEIPTSFGFMGSRLKEILFRNNDLTGCVPEGIGFLNQVQVLDFSFNSLVGHLPDTISCLNEIQVLNFAHNGLSGELPDLVCSLKKLINLTLAYNFFSGFDQDCGRLLFRGFDFSGNCIPGRVMQRSGQECSVVPGGGLSCLRIPVVQPIVCGTPTLSQTP